MVGAAANWRDNDAQSFYVDYVNLLPQHQQVDPGPLNRQIADRTKRRQIRRGISSKCQPARNETRIGEVGPVILRDLDLTGEHLFQQRFDVPVSVGPVFIDEVGAHEGCEDEYSSSAYEPHAERAGLLRCRNRSTGQRGGHDRSPKLFNFYPDEYEPIHRNDSR